MIKKEREGAVYLQRDGERQMMSKR